MGRARATYSSVKRFLFMAKLLSGMGEVCQKSRSQAGLKNGEQTNFPAREEARDRFWDRNYPLDALRIKWIIAPQPNVSKAFHPGRPDPENRWTSAGLVPAAASRLFMDHFDEYGHAL